MNSFNNNLKSGFGQRDCHGVQLPDDQITQLPNLRVLYVAYPLLTVSDESAGGAEQMLWILEREMVRRGVSATVAASAGSRVSGELFPTGDACTQPDDYERRNCEHQDKIVDFVRRRAREGRAFDLIHDKSGSFWPRAGELDLPVLATLHLPRGFYASQSLQNVPGNVSFNCVSNSQAQSFAGLPGLLGVVRNGIDLDSFMSGRENDVTRRREVLLWLGRICEEKAPHLALDIAAPTSQTITLAGQVYPFSYHQQYFEREVAPRLAQMPQARFVSSPSREEKRRLLREAQALLLTSLVDETSSLVAMEAAASGTPVIAFRRGAVPELVQDGLTGFLVDDVNSAAAALKDIDRIRPEACLSYARENFSAGAMAEGYAGIYAQIAQARKPVKRAG